MDGDQVLEMDKRGYFRIFYDYLLLKHIWFYTFIYTSISHPFYIRISLFFFGLSNSFCLNAILFSDDLINSRNVENDKVLINVIFYIYYIYYIYIFYLNVYIIESDIILYL